MDRNLLSQIAISETLLSLSARRAWIEIYWIADVYVTLPGRSPQGERG